MNLKETLIKINAVYLKRLCGRNIYINKGEFSERFDKLAQSCLVARNVVHVGPVEGKPISAGTGRPSKVAYNNSPVIRRSRGCGHTFF